MKKNKFLLLSIFLLYALGAYSQKIDTLYYDSDWKGVESKQFASFIRYLLYAENNNYKNRFRDYYITGELQSEGEFIYIDKYDDSKSIFGQSKSYYKKGNIETENNVENGNGQIISYYENGNIKQSLELKDSLLNGFAITYFENGLIHTICNCVNGEYEGIYSEFTENGDACKQIEMKNGKPTTPYYTYSTRNGYITKYKLTDNSPYLEMPTPTEKKTFYSNGDAWNYYIKNGLCLMVNASSNNTYGKYFTLNIVLTNNSTQPITFNPALITAFKKRKGKIKNLGVLSSNEYLTKVRRNQNWSLFAKALSENMAASKAGYSASSSQTNSIYSGASVSGAVAGTVGTHGSAVTAAAGVSGYAGLSSTTSTSVTYNGAAAYQANLIASDRIAEYSNQLIQEREIIDKGYLKITTIYPGESIAGYINIKYEKGNELYVNIPINSVIYPFSWIY